MKDLTAKDLFAAIASAAAFAGYFIFMWQVISFFC